MKQQYWCPGSAPDSPQDLKGVAHLSKSYSLHMSSEANNGYFTGGLKPGGK